MANTIYYNWPKPTADDYVKETATYIGNLANSIDDTLHTINGNSTPVGLHLISSTDFNSVTGVTLSGVFNSTYQNYKIVFTSAFSVSGASLYSQMCLNGTPAAGASSYVQAGIYKIYNSSTVQDLNDLSTTWKNFIYQGGTTSNGSFCSIDLINPALATKTLFNCSSYSDLQYWTTLSGAHTPNTAYDGIKLYATSGNMTGTVRVYGYRNT